MANKLTIGLGIIAVVMIVFASFIAYNKFIGTPDAPVVTGDSVYANYNPVDHIGKEWKLTGDAKSLADFQTSLRTKFIDNGTIDAAAWNFQNGDKALYVWARKFDTRANLESEEWLFINPVLWKTYTELVFADVGVTGMKKMPGQPVPLTLYMDKDNIMIYMYYYNAINANGAQDYTDKDIANDKKFLIDLTRDITGL